MKSLIKSIIPEGMMQVAQKIYSGLFDNTPKTEFSWKEDGEPGALKCTVSYNKYGGYCVPESSRHRPAAQTILSNDVYEPKTIEFIMTHCGNGDVVHAGTYFGDFLPALSKGVAPGSKIWAFEPNPENYRCARITLEINGIENVLLTNAGLGARQESLLIKTTDEDGRSLGGASQIIAGDSGRMAGAEAVQIVTVDDVVEVSRTVSIIQLDVEGHEKEALTGALKTVQRCLPIIILEVLPNSSLLGSDWFTENILSLGYRKINDIHGNSVFSRESQH
jgi:FkbM family methyltransferase